MGVTKVFLQSSDTRWDDRELLKIFRRADAITEESSRRTIEENPSGPAALCGFRLSNSLAIQAVVIQMGGIDGVRLGVWSKIALILTKLLQI